jgi:hypothetical protein
VGCHHHDGITGSFRFDAWGTEASCLLLAARGGKRTRFGGCVK